MCEAIQSIRDDARAEGRAEGILETLFSLVRDGILTLSEAARRADMTETEFEEKTKKMDQA